MANATPAVPSNKTGLYLILGILALLVAGLLLLALYFGLSYTALNLFLGLDLSTYGQLAVGSWPGYALLGLGLGAAAGAVAAQRRFRLSKHILTGASGFALVLVAFVLVGNAAHFAPPAQVAGPYVPSKGQGQCPACAAIAASSTRPDPAKNRYTPAKLLDKDPATAWISAEATNQTLRLTLTIPADQQLIGLRIHNGYGKNEGVYTSFSRVRTCRVSQEGGPATRWTLPDTNQEHSFIPFTLATPTTSAVLVFSIDDTYPGENHPEPALSSLVPVIEAAH